MDATVHWHGLRLDNRYDGTHETQSAIGMGERYTAHVAFPDPGVYWYHPHIREDYGQEMGLYGTVLVTQLTPTTGRPPIASSRSRRRPPARGRAVAPFSREETTHVGHGPLRRGHARRRRDRPVVGRTAGEVVRLYLTNTANTRMFNIAVPGARMKLVGGDSGHVEHEQFVDDVVIAPSERVVVDVLFDRPGDVTLEHRTPDAHLPAGARAGR